MRSWFALSLVLLVGCSGSVEGVENVDTTSEAVTSLTPAQIASYKAEIRRISLANATRKDNWSAVRAQLLPSITPLVASFGERSVKEKLPLVSGAWHQLWSDFPYTGISVISMDDKQIYQVVTTKGYYYNLGNDKALGFFPLAGVLRGAYEDAGNQLAIRFTKVGFRFGHLDRSRNLNSLVEGLESGADYIVPTPGGGKAPKGPINIQGTLKTVYVDEDLRIDVGTQTPFVDASGKVLVEGLGEKYFILERVTNPVR